MLSMQACFAKKNLWLCLNTLKLRCFKLSFDYPKIFFLYVKASKVFLGQTKIRVFKETYSHTKKKVQVD